MTALPATRHEALEMARVAERRLLAETQFTVPEVGQLVALLRRGAETVGATEAWLFSPADRNERTMVEVGAYYTIKEDGYADWEGESDRPIVRRCLILPDES